jgi:hypothetical protein
MKINCPVEKPLWPVILHPNSQFTGNFVPFMEGFAPLVG